MWSWVRAPRWVIFTTRPRPRLSLGGSVKPRARRLGVASASRRRSCCRRAVVLLKVREAWENSDTAIAHSDFRTPLPEGYSASLAQNQAILNVGQRPFAREPVRLPLPPRVRQGELPPASTLARGAEVALPIRSPSAQKFSPTSARARGAEFAAARRAARQGGEILAFEIPCPKTVAFPYGKAKRCSTSASARLIASPRAYRCRLASVVGSFRPRRLSSAGPTLPLRRRALRSSRGRRRSRAEPSLPPRRHKAPRRSRPPTVAPKANARGPRRCRRGPEPHGGRFRGAAKQRSANPRRVRKRVFH